MEPKEFTERLQLELRSAPQPYLIPFLKVRYLNLWIQIILVASCILVFWGFIISRKNLLSNKYYLLRFVPKYSHCLVWIHREGATLKHNALSKIYSHREGATLKHNALSKIYPHREGATLKHNALSKIYSHREGATLKHNALSKILLTLLWRVTRFCVDKCFLITGSSRQWRFLSL